MYNKMSRVAIIGVAALVICCSSLSAGMTMMGGEEDSTDQTGQTGPTGPAPPPSCRMLLKRTHDSDSSYTTLNQWISSPQQSEEACSARAGELAGHGAISAFTSTPPPICWSKIANVHSGDGRYKPSEIGLWMPDYEAYAYKNKASCDQRQIDLTPFGGETRFQLEKPQN